MAEQHGQWTDDRIERLMGLILRGGVLLAALWVIAGAVLYLARYHSTLPDYRLFRGEPSDLRYLTAIIAGALTLHPRLLMQTGLILLIATPVSRVAFSVIAFIIERDWLYVFVTLIVLSVLVYSFFGGA